MSSSLAHVQMKRLLLVLAAFFLAFPSFASIPATSGQVPAWNVSDQTGAGRGTTTSPASYCSDQVAYWSGAYSGSGVSITVNQSDTVCAILRNGAAFWTFSFSPTTIQGYTCPSGYVLNGTNCDSTKTGTSVAADLNASGKMLAGKGTPSLSTCYDGFTMTGTGAVGGFKNGTSTGFEIYGPFTGGAACTGDVAGGTGGSTIEQASTPSPSTCSGYWGSVNGVDTCVPKAPLTGITGAVDKSSSTSTTTGSTTSGSTTTGQTTCDGTNCTTTTTTTPSGGGTPTTTSQTKPQADFCSENPASAVCKKPSDCDEHPERIGCSTFGTADNSVQLGSRDSGFTGIVATAFTSNQACPAPLSFTVFGHSYATSFEPICSASTTYVAPVVLVLAAALSAFVFVGGFKS